jgi:hypothetical protein
MTHATLPAGAGLPPVACHPGGHRVAYAPRPMRRHRTTRSHHRSAALLVLLLALVTAACGGDGDEGASTDATPGGGGTQETGTPTTGPATSGTEGDVDGGALGQALAGASGADSWLTGSWEGTYTCGGGETPLRLTLLDVNNGPVEGFFEFGPEDEAAPESGAFRLRGDRTDGSLSLGGLDWIDQPEGSSMVGIEADVSEDGGDELAGTVVGAGCESFSVTRVSSDPWYVGTWQGGYICAQGRTDMTLTLEAVQGNGVEALVEFYAAAENPDVPSGSYRLAGIWADGGIHLDSVEWVDQPPGYVMVDVASNPELAIGPDKLAGRIQDPTCEQFIIERAEA